ncbi:hypothetical protein CLU84_2720 [Comamonas sp. 26]|nr:hypothetical protein CLU84_2720 [Comamonas sp. 26]
MTYSELELRRWTNELSRTFGCTAALLRLLSLSSAGGTAAGRSPAVIGFGRSVLVLAAS